MIAVEIQKKKFEAKIRSKQNGPWDAVVSSCQVFYHLRIGGQQIIFNTFNINLFAPKSYY